MSVILQSALGKATRYESTYNPDTLFPIPRAPKREELGISSLACPFQGKDSWVHYEVSWLNPKGKPIVAVAHLIYDCCSPMIIESKSMKLYFNSFNNTQFKSIDSVANAIERDISERIQSPVQVRLQKLSEIKTPILSAFSGECIDELDVTCQDYVVNPATLSVESNTVSEVLYSDLLKSNCLVTGQPDWASVQIAYEGFKINREGLLQYLVSLRNHNEFHEHCIERIFTDIAKHCHPKKLTVYGRYTRRGGIEINPLRSTQAVHADDFAIRLIRQ